MRKPPTITEIRELLHQYQIAPLKRYGQHFLHDANIQKKLKGVIHSFIETSPSLILEVGPGLGALTECLFAQKTPVYIIEIDNTLVQIIQEKYSLPLYRDFPASFLHKNLLIHNDFFSLDLNQPLTYQKPFLLAGNIPYQITSPLFFQLMEWHVQKPGYLQGAILVIQKEVAERINAPAHTRKYGILSVLLRCFFTTQLHFSVQPQSFYPVPRVTSACLSLSPEKRLTPETYNDLKALVKTAFSSRRKKVYSNIKDIISREDWDEFLKKTAHASTIRAEDIAPEEYLLLIEISKKKSKK